MSPWADTTTVAISNNMVIIIPILIAISISFPFGLNIHIAHFITRYLAHHELTQDEIDCSLVYRIAIAQRLQPCSHIIDGMNYRWLMSDV